MSRGKEGSSGRSRARIGRLRVTHILDPIEDGRLRCLVPSMAAAMTVLANHLTGIREAVTEVNDRVRADAVACRAESGPGRIRLEIEATQFPEECSPMLAHGVDKLPRVAFTFPGCDLVGSLRV